MSDPSRPLGSLPSSFDDERPEQRLSAMQRFFRNCKREPLIPIGVVATVYALSAAIRSIRQGDSRKVQFWFRMRIAAQGLTVLAMCAGGVYLSEERQREREQWNIEKQDSEAAKRNKWIEELEARDAEEKALRALEAERDQRRLARLNGAAAKADEKPGKPSGVLGAITGNPFRTSTTAEPSDAAAASGTDDDDDAPRNNKSQLGVLGGMFGKKRPASSDSDEKK